MKQEYIEKIKSYYDSQSEYKINSRYSGESGIVYTKANDNAHWLVVEQKGENKAEVRQTDDTGRIIARDTYESIRNTVKCTGVSRKKAEGKGMIKFEQDEINLIYQFGENGRQRTLDMLKALEPKITDGLTKSVVGSTIHKLSALSEESCSELVSSTKKRKQAERDCSIRKRLADAEKKVKERADKGRNKFSQRKQESFIL